MTARHVNLQCVRDKASKLKADILDQFDDNLQQMLDEFVQEVERLEQTSQSNGIPGVPRTRKTGELPDKEFILRRSVLTELLEINHIRTIYHIFVAILIVFTLNTIVFDLVDKGKLVLDFDLILWAFGQFPLVITLWGWMSLGTVLVVYPVFQYWVSIQGMKGILGKYKNYFFLLLYIAYQVAFLVLPVKYMFSKNVPPASSVIIVAEQVRLLMKTHAFVRENAPRVTRVKKDDDEETEPPCQDFSKYLYFLFAPTLVYRDSYPRTPTIRWNYVVSNFAQVLASLVYVNFIFVRFCVPVFQNFNRDHVTAKSLMLSTFGSMLPGTLVLFVAFFAILHSWLNAFAEMLRFGDRLFYKDWWNSSSFANYYRTWNVVVHDWLYTYVYKDTFKLLHKPNRPAAMASVFLLSAVFHEYILSIAFGFFYPVLFFMFAGFGFAFLFLTKKGHQRSGNIFMWVSLFMGTGLIMCLYSLEWYARQSCPIISEYSFLDRMIPRSWTCDFSHLNDNGH